MSTRIVCEERGCGWKGEKDECLTANNPFDDQETIIGCPKCKGINTMRSTCDAPDCWEQDTMWISTPSGYRRTCYKHRPKEWDE